MIADTDYYVRPDFRNNPKVFKQREIFLTIPKLVTKFVSNTIEFAMDTVGYCNTNVVYNVHVDEGVNLYFLLGVLNSKAVNFWFKIVYVNDDTLFPHIQKNQLESIPIPQIDLTDKLQKKVFDEIVLRAGNLLELYQEKENAMFGSAVKSTEQKIAYCEDRINALVYQLYGLTDEEIKTVEENGNRKTNQKPA